jgi:DNA-binding transcriptional regulator YiaG
MDNSEKMARLIAKLGMSRLQIADYLGVTERTVYRWIAGDTQPPKMAFIALELLQKKK